MKNYPNKFVKNVKSPPNEDAYRRIYKQINPKSAIPDGMDISAVQTLKGERGHAMLPASANRSRDKRIHRGVDFISNSELRREMNVRKKK